MWTKISESWARKMYYAGYRVVLVPSKCHVRNTLFRAEIKLNGEKPEELAEATDFDGIVNAFEYYNCDKELGRHSAFYVEEEDIADYKERRKV